MDTPLDLMCEADLHQALVSMAPGGFWQDESYFAPCPVHAEPDPDLLFSYSRRTRTWNCGGGCGKGDVASLGVLLWRCGVAEAIDRITALSGGEHCVESRYPYHDANGGFLFEVLRYSPKAFATRIPLQWFWNDVVRGVPMPLYKTLYRLEELLHADEVLIVEGEKDCETARGLGLVATCNPGGSSRWSQEYAGYFHGKDVRIIADADPSGRRHGCNIAGSLVPVARSVKMLEFPEVKDLTEWIEAGGSVPELTALFANVPPLRADEVVGWWDPAFTVRLICEADFLFNLSAFQSADEPGSDEPAVPEMESADVFGASVSAGEDGLFEPSESA